MSNLNTHEEFSTRSPEGMMCKTCKYKMKPITVAGYTQDRSGYSVCDRYTRKPHEILWEGAQCPMYRSEDV